MTDDKQSVHSKKFEEGEDFVRLFMRCANSYLYSIFTQNNLRISKAVKN